MKKEVVQYESPWALVAINGVGFAVPTFQTFKYLNVHTLTCDIMKYELIPKEVLDEVCATLLEIGRNAGTNTSKVDCAAISLACERAYNSIQHNRATCNVRPEGE